MSKIFNAGLVLHLVSGISNKISSGKVLYFKRYEPKILTSGVENTPTAFRVKIWLLLLPAIPTNCNKLIVKFVMAIDTKSYLSCAAHHFFGAEEH